jgi:hypothetical protein
MAILHSRTPTGPKTAVNLGSLRSHVHAYRIKRTRIAPGASRRRVAGSSCLGVLSRAWPNQGRSSASRRRRHAEGGFWTLGAVRATRPIIKSHGYQKSTKTDPLWANWVRTRWSSAPRRGTHYLVAKPLAVLRTKRTLAPRKSRLANLPRPADRRHEDLDSSHTRRRSRQKTWRSWSAPGV